MIRSLILRATNAAVAWSLLLACLRVLGAILVLPVIVRCLPKDELGLWYVFLSIGALTGLLDVGFSPTMARAIGFIWGGAKELKPLGIHREDISTHSEPNFPLLEKLIATMRAYYRILSCGVLLLMLTAGSWWIWHKTTGMPNASTYRWAWIFFSLGGYINNNNAVWPALLSGMNRVRESEQLWVLSTLINYAIVFGVLMYNGGIWAMVSGQLISGLVLRLRGRYHCLFFLGNRVDLKNGRCDWHLLKILWPMAWRSAGVGVSGFLILNANTLICSAYLGLAETASYGLTLQVIGFVSTLSVSWITVKYPLITQLRARHRVDQIIPIVIQRMRWVLGTYFLGALIVFFIGNQLLILIHAKTTLMPPPLLAVFLLVYMLEMHHAKYGDLVITENQNPFVLPLLLSGIAIVALSIVLTPRLGLWGIIISMGIVELSCNNWWQVLRAIRGLGLSAKEYGTLFFGLRKMQ